MLRRVDKDAFLSAWTCRTRGWHAFREAGGPPSPGAAWRMLTGQELHRIAREQLAVAMSLPRAPEAAAVAATADALSDANLSTVSEATFVFGAFVARADFLRRNGGGWDLIEVKSGTEPEDKITKKGIKKGVPSSEYLNDLAYTAFVARNAGLPIARCLLMLISREFRFGDSKGPLVEVDVTSEVTGLVEAYCGVAPAIASAVLESEAPEAELILACRKCPYFAAPCFGNTIPDPVFDLPRLSEKRFEEIKAHQRIAALPEDVALTAPQQRVASATRAGVPSVSADGLALLDLLRWPAYYLDFESVGPALPWFGGAAPYEAMPFQYSVHVKLTPEASPQHFEYLAPSSGDWRRELAERLIPRLGTEGSVLMYSAYEKRMLGYLAGTFEDLAPALKAIQLRLFDLEAVIEAAYCHPGFRGHTSIKNVLPVMVPDLTYAALAIRGGEDASGTFALMHLNSIPADRQNAERESLLAYCKLDTLAMVRVHEVLLRIRGEIRPDVSS